MVSIYSKTEKDTIVETLLRDRRRTYGHEGVSWAKKNAIDLAIKLIIVLINSVGKKTSKNSYCFINEINNSSMTANLMITKGIFLKRNRCANTLEFFRKSDNTHMKTGVLVPLFLSLMVLVRSFVIIIHGCVFRKSAELEMIEMLYHHFTEYIESFDCTVKSYILMTDHHFYSSIIAMSYTQKANVLQHGLIKEIDYYYPIRAGRFYCWGKRSKKLLRNDDKTIIAGTYKFDNVFSRNSNSDMRTVLFCISSLDKECVKNKIDVLLRIVETQGFKLKVKCHPGSLFKLDYWRSLYSGEDIIWYQEEMIQDIKFDFAVTEDSTIIVDFLYMNKPFILYDRKNGYFKDYLNIIPNGNTQDEMEMCFKNLRKYDFNRIFDLFKKEELNDGKCLIIENVVGEGVLE